MSKNGHKPSISCFERLLRLVLWLGVGVFCVGLVIIVPLSIILVGIGVLSQAMLGEALFIILSVILLTVGYWALVWLSEKSGIAHWNMDKREAVNPDIYKWDEEKD